MICVYVIVCVLVAWLAVYTVFGKDYSEYEALYQEHKDTTEE